MCCGQSVFGAIIVSLTLLLALVVIPYLSLRSFLLFASCPLIIFLPILLPLSLSVPFSRYQFQRLISSSAPPAFLSPLHIHTLILIGPFLQVRTARAKLKRGDWSEQQYDSFVHTQIEQCVRKQEELVLVPGEFERNCMVESFRR